MTAPGKAHDFPVARLPAGGLFFLLSLSDVVIDAHQRRGRFDGDGLAGAVKGHSAAPPDLYQIGQVAQRVDRRHRLFVLFDLGLPPLRGFTQTVGLPLVSAC